MKGICVLKPNVNISRSAQLNFSVSTPLILSCVRSTCSKFIWMYWQSKNMCISMYTLEYIQRIVTKCGFCQACTLYMYISKIIWSDVGVYAHQYIPFPHKSCQSQWFRKIRISFYASNTFTREKDRLLSKTISFFTRSGIKQIAATNEMQWSSCLHGHGYESFLLMAPRCKFNVWRMDEIHWSVQYI